MIVTFYSFKGGVGRSFSLVETALQLAGRGSSVLVWDLDLEAPGLQKLPYLQALEENLTAGTLDLLREFQKDYKLPSLDEFRRAILTFTPPEEHGRLKGRLDFLLPAHLDESYPEKFGDVDWETQLSPDAAGSAFFHGAASYFRKEYDYILIDSRTGFNRLSAVCSLQLPDLVVLVFNYNEQNLEGTAQVHRVITRTPAPLSGDIPALLLATMVPRQPSRLLKEKEATRNRLGLDVAYEIFLQPDLLLTDLLPSLDPSPAQDVLHTRATYGLLADDIEARGRDLKVDQEKVDRRKLERARGDREQLARLRQQGVYPHIRDFVDKVAQVFSFHGYETKEDHRSGGHEFDLRLEISRGLLPVVALVECRTGGSPRISPEEVEQTAERVKTACEADRLSYQAMLITTSEPSAAVREAAATERVQIQTYKQLLLSLIEPTALLDRSILAHQGTALERQYVDPDILVEGSRSGAGARPGSLTDTVSQWLRRPTGRLFVLLGEPGGGKTSFCHRLAYQLASRARREWSGGKLESRIPVHIDLRDPAAAGSIESLLHQQIQRLSPKAVHPQAPMLLNQEGRLLLLLDGFDEIAGHTGHGQSLELLRRLLRAAETQAKILLTSRPHLFRDRPEPETKGEDRPETRLYEEVCDNFQAVVGYIKDFSTAQIQEYLQKALPPPASWQQVEERIYRTPGLQELAARPFLLNLIVEAFPELSGESRSINLAHLYEAYCQSWFEQDDFRLNLGQAWWATLVEQLARLVWDSPQGLIHAEVLIEKGMELFQGRAIPPSKREKIDGELRTAPFLRRDPAGYYSFAHPTFLEFFVARSLREGLVLDDPGCLDIRRISRQISAFIEDWPEAAGKIPRLTAAVLSQPCQSPRSENALLLLYLHAQAAAGRPDGSGEEDPAYFTTVREKFSALRPERIFLEGADLEGAVLPGISLKGAMMQGVRLARADLRHAELTEALLSRADLSFADGRDLLADMADLTNADLSHLDGRGSSFRKARFLGANLAFARLARAKLRDAAFDDSPEHPGIGLLGTELAAGDALRLETSVSSSLTFRPQFGPSAPVTDLAWSPDGRFLATLIDRRMAVIWDPRSAERLLTFERTGEELQALAWGPDIALASARGRILRWDPKVDQISSVVDSPQNVTRLSWSPTRSQLAVAIRSANHTRSEIHLRDLVGDGEFRQLGEHTGKITALAWKPDGQQLASASTDQTVYLWDLQYGEPQKAWSLQSRDPIALHWSEDGRVLTVVFQNGRILTLPLSHDLQIEALPLGIPSEEARPSGGHLPSHFLWSPHSTDLFAIVREDNPPEVQRGTDVTTVKRLSGVPSFAASFMSWSPGSVYLAAGFTRAGLHLWDLRHGSPVPLPASGLETALAVGWANADQTLVALRQDLSCLTLDLGTGTAAEPIPPRSGRTALVAVVSRDGQTSAAALDHDESILVRTGPADTLLTRISTESNRVLALRLTPDGNQLAAACEDHVRLWERETGAVRILDAQGKHEAVCLAWSADKQRLATGDQNGEIRIWDVQSGRTLSSLREQDQESIDALAWSEAGVLASVSKDRRLRIWDVEKGGSPTQKVLLEGRGSTLEWPVPSRLAIVLDDSIEIWAAGSGRPMRVARLFALPGGPLAVTEDGYVSGSPEALRAARFGHGWALYDLDDVPERHAPEKVAAALLPPAPAA